jgi:hypothetical protein
MDITRVLADGSTYRLYLVGKSVVLTLSHPDAQFTPVEVTRFRDDLASVAGAVGR